MNNLKQTHQLQINSSIVYEVILRMINIAFTKNIGSTGYTICNILVPGLDIKRNVYRISSSP